MENAIDIDKMVEKYGNDILRLCLFYLKNRHSAEDAVQDIFVKVYKKYYSIKQKESEKAWIFRISANVCKNYLRTSWLKRVILVDKLEDYFFNVESQDMLINESDNQLLQQIMQLKPIYKEVILLYYYQQFKASEISEILKLKESTVTVRLSRAREQLKLALDRSDYDGRKITQSKPTY